jgi:hypothetical protein
LFEPERPDGHPRGVVTVLGHPEVHMGTKAVTSH